jgi:hypothetical protein
MSRIVSFRGLIADNAQDTIVLHTNDGSIGYRIVKFEIMPNDYGSKNSEHMVKIFKVSQTTFPGEIDFSDNRLLGVALMSNSTSASIYPSLGSVIFDNEVFNQDIYVTHVDKGVSEPCNYYIELEQMPLDLNENTVATLKDIRNTD